MEPIATLMATPLATPMAWPMAIRWPSSSTSLKDIKRLKDSLVLFKEQIILTQRAVKNEN